MPNFGERLRGIEKKITCFSALGLFVFALAGCDSLNTTPDIENPIITMVGGYVEKVDFGDIEITRGDPNNPRNIDVNYFPNDWDDPIRADEQIKLVVEAIKESCEGEEVIVFEKPNSAELTLGPEADKNCIDMTSK